MLMTNKQGYSPVLNIGGPFLKRQLQSSNIRVTITKYRKNGAKQIVLTKSQQNIGSAQQKIENVDFFTPSKNGCKQGETQYREFG